MHPVLFEWGWFKVHSYGFMIAIGFLLAVFLSSHLSKKEGIDPKKTIDLAFWLLIVGFIGSRVLYFFTQLDVFFADPMAFFRFWEGGFVFLGGLLGAIPFGIYYVKKHKLAPWKIADIGFLVIPLAHGFGRLGCLLAGCCHGKACDYPWAIQLHSELVDFRLRGVPIHPTQIYEAFSLFIIFIILYFVYKKKKFDGQVTVIYLMLYPIARSIIEIYRGDTVRGFVIDDLISTSQFISFWVFIGATIILIYRLKKTQK